MAHKNFEKMDNTENVEKVEQGEKTEGKEKESILSKVKNFFAEHGKNKESKEQKSEENDNKEEKEDKKGNSFRESLRVTQTPEEVAKYNINTIAESKNAIQTEVLSKLRTELESTDFLVGVDLIIAYE